MSQSIRSFLFDADNNERASFPLIDDRIDVGRVLIDVSNIPHDEDYFVTFEDMNLDVIFDVAYYPTQDNAQSGNCFASIYVRTRADVPHIDVRRYLSEKTATGDQRQVLRRFFPLDIDKIDELDFEDGMTYDDLIDFLLLTF